MSIEPLSALRPLINTFLTLSDAHDSDATSARTPATYAKTFSNHSASYKRLQPARQPFTNPAATCAAAAAQEQRKRSRSSLHQLASSADLTASAPRLRGGSYVTYGRQMTSHIDSSDFRFRGSVRERTRRSSSKSNSQCEEDTNARSSGSTYARGFPRRHARQQRHENNQEQPHQVAPSADPTASAPQLRGGSHVAIKFQRTSRIDSSDFRFRGSMRDRTRSGSSKTDSQRSKELKRKTSVATTVAPCARGRACRARRPAIATRTRDDDYNNRGNLRADLRGSREGTKQF
ncbi:hypothetical protein EDB85DRAFT_2165496 [Lactarius pseudohatsudake]|nr:hypothetical protein EDB85DRAFT_2165496 [Lactarius pseudohatsudake]